MTVDYSELAEQVKGPINSGYFGGGQTTARVAFKYLLGAGRVGQRRHVSPAEVGAAAGQILSAVADRPDGQLFDPVSDRDRHRDQGAGAGAAGARAGRPFRHPFGHRASTASAPTARSSAPMTAAMAAGAPAPPTTAAVRSAPWRMAIPASFRWSCRRPACRSGSRNSRCGRIPRGAGTFRGGLGLPQELSHTGALHAADQSRPHPVPALGGAGRQGGGARTLHPGAAGPERRAADREGEGPCARARRFVACRDRRRRRLWAASNGGSRDDPARSRCRYVSPAAAERDYGITIGRDGKAHR